MPAKKVRPDGGVAVELSTAGVAAGNLEGGILFGFAVRTFVIGLSGNFVSSTAEVTSGTAKASVSSARVRLGIGFRVPLFHPGDGRVELFAAGDLGLLSRNAGGAIVNGVASSGSNAVGPTAAIGPGLRFWLSDHLAVGYVTLLRWTNLSGTAAAFPDVSITPSDGDVSGSDVQLEGSFQMLGVF